MSEKKKHHRSVERINNDIATCNHVIREKQVQREALQQELARHPEIITRQLNQWDVPAQQHHRIEELCVSYDPAVSREQGGGRAGTTLTVLEEWTFHVTIDGHCYPFSASRWTGQTWEAYGFYRLSGGEDDEYVNLSGESLWNAAMRENARCDSPVAASVVTLGFCDIEFGTGDIVNKF